MCEAPSERTPVLTLNQDKRRRFDSYPGSQHAGQCVTGYAGSVSQDRDLAPRCALTHHEYTPGGTMNTQTEPTTVLVYRPGFGWVERPAS
jgi:hypothetical protein